MLRRRHSSSRSSKPLSGGCAVLFGLPFILGGLAAGFLYMPAIVSWWSARGWEEAPCWIEKAELKTSHSSKGGTSYRVEAVYRYEFHRHSYHGTQVSFFGGSDNMGDFQQQAFRELETAKNKGRPIHCYVNPSRPEQAVLFRELRWGVLLLMSIFPTLFPLAGALVAIGGGLQSRKAAKNAGLEARHPGEPWRWRTEWVGDAIRPSPDGLPFILAVAGWILLVQLPLALAVVLGGEMAKSPLAACALLPSLLALIPLYFAWKRIRSRRALGQPELRLKKLPLSPGQPLAGELKFARALAPSEVLRARILCERHITRNSGDSHATVEETIWEHTETLSSAMARRDVDGTTLPLSIAIPAGLPSSAVDQESIDNSPGERHVWTLKVSSEQMPGSKPVEFPLPVFATGNTVVDEEHAAQQEAGPPLLTSDDLSARLQARGLQVEFGPGGIPLVIDCPAARFRGAGIFLLVFAAIWSGGFAFLCHQGAPLLFRLFWGITSPLIFAGGVWTLLHSRRVEILAGGLHIANRLGPFFSWGESLEPRHITGFSHDTNMQSGNKFYYRVRAETIFNKKRTLVDGITESVTAETLAERFEEWRKRG
ncbi:DUF3592 domain-containing protein [Prosthecobacter sp.]|uniref:DUF3592 domain-containing protein n=1 Tax=Prosthecobacter sp. TaxID=1965333 RepID=UPI0037841EA0